MPLTVWHAYSTYTFQNIDICLLEWLCNSTGPSYKLYFSISYTYFRCGNKTLYFAIYSRDITKSLRLDSGLENDEIYLIKCYFRRKKNSSKCHFVVCLWSNLHYNRLNYILNFFVLKWNFVSTNQSNGNVYWSSISFNDVSWWVILTLFSLIFS